MATLVFDEVWEAVRKLSPEEQQRLVKLIEAVKAKPALRADLDRISPQDQVALERLKEGKLSHIPPPPTAEDIKRWQEWKPVPIEGKPISETIIEERR